MLLPPSETKRVPPDSGKTLQFDELSFKELNPTRRIILDALIETSTRHDALKRLFVGVLATDEVLRNVHLIDSPTRPAVDTYLGPLYEALDARSMSTAVRRKAEQRLIIVSALWGALRPSDHIPAYRMHVCAKLVGLGSLEPMWRPVLAPVLTNAGESQGVVIDFRSSSFLAVGSPTGLDERTVLVRITRPGSTQSASAYGAKYTRGEVARALLELDDPPQAPNDVPEVIADRWSVNLEAPIRPGKPWSLNVETDP